MGRTENVFEMREQQLVGGEEEIVEFLLRVEQKTALKQQPHVAQLTRVAFSRSEGCGRRESISLERACELSPTTNQTFKLDYTGLH